MGETLHLLMGSGAECPYSPHSDFKALGFYLYRGHILKDGQFLDVIGRIGRFLRIDIGPLERIFAPNYDGSDGAWIEAAQPPGALADCLQRIVRAFEGDPSFLQKAGILDPATSNYQSRDEVKSSTDYFIEGCFLQDLSDLLRMAKWAKENGENQVRLYYG